MKYKLTCNHEPATDSMYSIIIGLVRMADPRIVYGEFSNDGFNIKFAYRHDAETFRDLLLLLHFPALALSIIAI